MKVLVLGKAISGIFFGDLVNILAENGVEYDPVEVPEDLAELTRLSEGHEAVITFFPLDAAKIAALAPSVRGVIVTSIGFDNIDVDAANKRGMMVCNIPDYSTEEVALHSVTLLLASLRNICLYDKTIRGGGWSTRSMVCGRRRHRLSTMTMGFLGFGRIGQRVSHMMQGFGVSMIAYDPYVPDEIFASHGVTRASTLDEVYAQADLISVHMLLNKETYHMIGEDSIQKMKDGVIIVNTARGGLLSLDTVADGLKSGKIGAAGIDVWEEEPVPKDHPILKDDNAIVTPHCAYYSLEADMDLRVKSLNTAIALCKGEIPYNCVNKKALGLK